MLLVVIVFIVFDNVAVPCGSRIAAEVVSYRANDNVRLESYRAIELRIL